MEKNINQKLRFLKQFKEDTKLKKIHSNRQNFITPSKLQQ